MIITLLSDYGYGDEFVGVMHAVIRAILPEAQIVDLTHGVTRHDVRGGALALSRALPYAPVGVHLAVVDPQVGTERRAIAVRCADGRLLVGPDNGLLSLAWERAGGLVEAIDVSRSQHRLEPISATFHGRDLFAPVAAALAAGAELAEAGQLLDPAELVSIDLPAPRLDPDGGRAVGHVIGIDVYGNVALDLVHADLLELGLTLGAAVSVTGPGGSLEAQLVQTFADVAGSATLLYEDAWGAVAVAVNRGSAAEQLAVSRDDELRIARL
ncbi:MAG: SAM-dependent chlorinase/fluorinase [Thermoleophilaceae bacterium]